MKKPKVIVIGLDGATWDLIKPWADEGELPTFKKLMKEGAWGEFESTMPPVTAPAWASFLTGKNPGKTGIYDFLYLKEKFPPKVGVSSGYMIRKNNLLTILSDHGFKVVSINIPMTYPPYEINGSLITGVETPPGKKFSYPDSLYKELIDGDYFPEPDISYIPGKEKEYLTDLYSIIEKRNKILLNFLNERNFDLLLFFFRETDMVAHTFWRYLDENHPLHPEDNRFSKTILDIYKKADELLKDVLERKDEDTLIIVMSDHGFGSEYFRVNLNRWLLEKGYISLYSNLKTATKKLANEFISPAKVWDIIIKLGLKKFGEIKKKQTNIGDKGLASKLFLNFDDINWERTEAYSIGCIGRHLPIFIKNGMSEARLDKIMKDIFSLNEHLGKEVVKDVIDTREVYTKNSENILPDLFVEFIEPYAGYTLPPPYISEGNSILSKSPITQSGAHKTTGILMVIGPEVKSGEIRKSSITDIAPTLLTLFGIKPLEEMDGRVLKEIFKESKFMEETSLYNKINERKRIKEKIRTLKMHEKI